MLACILAFWTSAAFFICIRCGRKTLFFRISQILSVISTAVIINVTIIARGGGARNVILIPFYSFYLAQRQKEYYRTMFMNVALFVPLGLFFPYADGGRKRSRLLRILLTGVMFSFLIEILQFALMRGETEVDDVIMNTLGTLLGESSYLVFSLMERKTRKGYGNQT